MTIPTHYKDREYQSFEESPSGSNLPARRVKITNPEEIQSGGNSGATTPKITNLSLPVVNTEVSHTLVNNLKQVIIRSRDKSKLQIAFTATESGTNFITVNAGATLTLSNLNLTSQTLFIQSDKVSTVEILELS